MWGRDEADVLDADRGVASVLLALAAFDDAGRRVTPLSVLERVTGQGPHALAAIAAPQGVAIASGSTVLAATDHVGLSAVYHAAADGAAVAGSSSRLLATLLGRGLDDDAVSAFSVLGEYAATDTPFDGVRRLAASQMARLADGALTIEHYAAPPAPERGSRDVGALVAEGVEAVRASVGACVDAYPEAAMELSGGLDSRVILAALVGSGRPPAGGLTLGERVPPRRRGRPRPRAPRRRPVPAGRPHRHVAALAGRRAGAGRRGRPAARLLGQLRRARRARVGRPGGRDAAAADLRPERRARARLLLPLPAPVAPDQRHARPRAGALAPDGQRAGVGRAVRPGGHRRGREPRGACRRARCCRRRAATG